MNYYAEVTNVPHMGSFKVFKNGTIISDPCKIVRGESAWDEFCQQTQKLRRRGRMHRWIPFSFRGYEMKLYYTGGGGLYFGVPVDSGMLIKLKYSDAIFLITAPAREELVKKKTGCTVSLLARLKAATND